MKITVRESGGKEFSIPLPTTLLCSQTLVSWGLRIGRRYSPAVPELQPQAVRALCDAVSQVRQRHGGWELVHVESADGDTVSITL